MKPLGEERYSMDEFFTLYLQGLLNIDVPKDEPKVPKQPKKKPKTNESTKNKNDDPESELIEKEPAEGLRRSARLSKTPPTKPTDEDDKEEDHPVSKKKRKTNAQITEYRQKLNIVQTFEQCGKSCSDLTKEAQNLTSHNIEPEDWIKMANELKRKATEIAAQIRNAKYAIDIQFPQAIELNQTDATESGNENEDDSDWTNDESTDDENESHEASTSTPEEHIKNITEDTEVVETETTNDNMTEKDKNINVHSTIDREDDTMTPEPNNEATELHTTEPETENETTTIKPTSPRIDVTMEKEDNHQKETTILDNTTDTYIPPQNETSNSNT